PGLPALPGPACPQRDLALALVISRVVAPGSKLSTCTWWGDTTLGADLGVAQVPVDEVYAAMDWLAARQDAIEARLARRHLAPDGHGRGPGHDHQRPHRGAEGAGQHVRVDHRAARPRHQEAHRRRRPAAAEPVR